MPDRPPVQLSRGDVLRIGRAHECEISVADPSLSRIHAVVRFDESGATIEDHDSRHGTRVNGQRCAPRLPVRIDDGFHITCGPIQIRVERAYARLATELGHEVSERVRTVELGEEGVAEQMLRVLFDVVRSISSEMTEEAAGVLLLTRLIGVLGLDRGLIVRRLGTAAEVQVIARVGSEAGALSRNLLAAAEQPNRVAQLSQTEDLRYAESVIGSGTREVLCARLQVRGDENLYIYLDSRQPASAVGANMAEFVGVAARVCSLVFDGIARRRLEEVRLDYARAAAVQQRLLPARQGEAGSVAWALESLPAAPPDEADIGSNVSGDIVGIAARPDGSVLAWVGDVSGHGPGAALLMSAAQAWLHAAAGRVEEPAITVAALNGFLYQHTEAHDFASLLVVAFERDGTVVLCDAGHGQAFRVHESGVEMIKFHAHEGGAVVGAFPDGLYASKSIPMRVGDRLVITTDGVHESRSLEGEEFGVDRIAAALADSTGAQSDVRTLLEVLRGFNGGVLRDDLTILSIACTDAPPETRG